MIEMLWVTIAVMSGWRTGWRLAAIAGLFRLAVSCGGSSGFGGSPCQMICEKRNSCATAADEVLPCNAICVYGGNYGPGLAPSPVCPNLAAQTACIQAAVAMSCDAYANAAALCPPCGVLDGAPCASDQDCQKYQPNYRCDLSRPGGYCTAPCQTADDCSIAGPEICTASTAPSFDPGAPATQDWCLLGCQTDAQCRTSDGYRCVSSNLAGGYSTSVCDSSGAGGGDGGTGGPPSAYWEQVTCSVTRTECSGWAEDDVSGVAGTDVNCPVANLLTNSFLATTCFQVPADGTAATQQADAQAACDTWCSGAGGFQGPYPLGTLAGVAGSNVTCAAAIESGGLTSAAAGQCATSAGPSAGATEFALCTLGGRTCASVQTAKDGTPYCASMPSVVGGESTSGCFDPTLTTAQAFCENGLQFPRTPVGASSMADEFPFWNVSQVQLNNTPAECQAEANSIAFARTATAARRAGR